ncbi:uncharacterized protein LOC121854070, partial [Homarus americanus]|uniref:uncharacterized protein LOC121854070 n=1 Tax=Homarus americanus TaxID=6706 RepID=UPI001C462F04
MARGIQINPYYGWEDNMEYTIVLGLQCVEEGEVWLVSCRPPITKKPIKNLTTISQCNNPINKRTLFAVINEIIKKPQRTTKGTYHLILCLVDPTCLEHNAPRKNLPLHMFLNDYSIKNLPGVISRGDIIQVKNMVVKLHQHRSYGKVYSSKSVARYPSSVGHDLVAVTDKENYVLTEEEKEIIIHLKEWWAKHCSEFTPQGEVHCTVKRTRNVAEESAQTCKLPNTPKTRPSDSDAGIPAKHLKSPGFEPTSHEPMTVSATPPTIPSPVSATPPTIPSPVSAASPTIP